MLDICNQFNWENKYRQVLNNHPVSCCTQQLLITDVLKMVNYFRRKHNEDGEYISNIMHETMNYFHGVKIPISNNNNRYGQDDFERVMFNLNELLKWIKRFKIEQRKDSINKIFKGKH